MCYTLIDGNHKSKSVNSCEKECNKEYSSRITLEYMQPHGEHKANYYFTLY